MSKSKFLKQIAYKILKDSKGQAMLEVSVTLFTFILLFFAALNFGFVIYQTHTLYQAANRGIRAAVTSGTTDPTKLANEVKSEINKALGIQTGKTPVFGFKFTVQEPITIPANSDEPIQVTILSEPQIMVLQNFFKKDPNKKIDAPDNIRQFKITATAFPNHRGLPKTTAPKPAKAAGG